MTLDKLQLIATVVVPASFKVQWLSWWNSSTLSKKALHFLAKPISDKELEVWLSKASFYARVTFYIYSFSSKLYTFDCHCSLFNLLENSILFILSLFLGAHSLKMLLWSHLKRL